MISRLSSAFRIVQGLGKCLKETPRRLYFEGKFTEESRSKILKVLNEFDEANELTKYSITKGNSKKLLVQRNSVGSYSNLEDPLSAVAPKVLETFYKSILREGKPPRFQGTAITPTLTPETRARASKVLSVSAVGNTVSWSVISRKRDPDDKLVLSLEALSVEDIVLKPRTHFLAVLQLMRNIVKSLPECDLYVFEEAASTVPNAQLVAYALQKTQCQSYLMGMLSSRSEESQLVSIKTVAIARLFKLHVGTEKVSGQAVVENMMSTKENFLISEVIRWNFLNAEATRREHLANAVLLNIAYWKLSNQF